MSRLAELQRLFVASAFGAPEKSFVAAVTGGGRLTPGDAVEVYRRGYPARLSEALGETFRSCWRVLGDEDFLAACAEYARAVPSTSHNLSDYGRTFPEFLKERHGAHAPFIAELGRLEWEYKEIFHRAPHASLTAKELAAKATEKSVFTLGAATALLSFEFKVTGIWTRDKTNETALTKEDWTGAERVLLFKRGDNEVRHVELDRPAFQVLTALRDGKKLDDALASADGMDERAVGSLFEFIAKNGLVESVHDE